MSDKETIAIFFASFSGAIVYWIFVFGKYIANSLFNNQMPLDAVIILVPIIIISWAGCFFIFIPIYILLKKFKKFNLTYILVLAPIGAMLLQIFITGSMLNQVDFYIGSFLSGIIGGAIFYYLINKEKIKRDGEKI